MVGFSWNREGLFDYPAPRGSLVKANIMFLVIISAGVIVCRE